MPQETPNPFAFMMGGKNKKKPVEYLKEKLEAEGFEVTIYESMMDKMCIRDSVRGTRIYQRAGA